MVHVRQSTTGKNMIETSRTFQLSGIGFNLHNSEGTVIQGCLGSARLWEKHQSIWRPNLITAPLSLRANCGINRLYHRSWTQHPSGQTYSDLQISSVLDRAPSWCFVPFSLVWSSTILPPPRQYSFGTNHRDDRLIPYRSGRNNAFCTSSTRRFRSIRSYNLNIDSPSPSSCRNRGKW